MSLAVTPYCSSEWSFESYEPSRLERQWVHHARPWQERLCAHVGEQRDSVFAWLAYVKRNGASQGSHPPDPGVFSTLTFKRAFNGTVDRAVRYIEPLAAALRHPLSFCDVKANFSMRCTSKRDCQGVQRYTEATLPHVFSRESWLLLSTPVALNKDLGARAALFDLGASRYTSGPGGESTRWFVRHFAHQGVTFDDIYAWEANPIDPASYWAEVPPSVKRSLHYFNTPASAQEGSPDNPLTLLAAVCRPCDFIVIKIDVDVAELEEAWIHQIRNSKRLAACIDVLFFEHHVGVPHAVAQNWWGAHRYARSGDVATSYALFSALRREGILAHSWP